MSCSLIAQYECIFTLRCCIATLSVLNLDLDLDGPYRNHKVKAGNVLTLHKTTNPFTDFEEWLKTLKQTSVRVFPIDIDESNFVRTVEKALFSIVSPQPFKTNVQFVAVSEEALTGCLDLDPVVRESQLFLDFISGNNRSGLFPLSLAHRYGGHQFGYWAGQLGDGRALVLGDRINTNSEIWELHLKGSGLTPYSRRGDGRAVLRSSVREFLSSEAMYHLGLPTSRAVSLVVSDDSVTRDQFYDGHPVSERGAMVLRLAPSWFRFGSVEMLSRSGETHLLKSLLNHIINNYYKQIDINDTDKYLHLFQEIVTGTAKMIAKWQSVGFTHGVCNTDNFSLLSITIDYGPFGFMDAYNPKFVPNTSDDEGRYSYENQPDVGLYNLGKLREALEPVLRKSQYSASRIILDGYVEVYKQNFLEIFTKKLGLHTVQRDKDESLVGMFFKILSDTKTDFTMSFRQLGEISIDDLLHGAIDNNYWALVQMADHEIFHHFLKLYKSRLISDGVNDSLRQETMNSHNPCYILRNWMLQNAIAKAEANDFSVVQNLLQIMKKPYTRQEEANGLGYASKPPYWASHIKVSCSS